MSRVYQRVFYLTFSLVFDQLRLKAARTKTTYFRSYPILTIYGSVISLHVFNVSYFESGSH